MHVGNQTELDSFEFSGGGIPVINKFLFNQIFNIILMISIFVTLYLQAICHFKQDNFTADDLVVDWYSCLDDHGSC